MDDRVRDRVEALRRAHPSSSARLDAWLSDPEHKNNLSEILGSIPADVDVLEDGALELLMAACDSEQAPAEIWSLFDAALDNVPYGFRELTARLWPIAREAPDPIEVLRPATTLLLNLGPTELDVLALAVEVPTKFAQEKRGSDRKGDAIQKEREAGGPIRESTTWRALLAQQPRPDFSELYVPFFEALTVSDGEELVELCQSNLDEPELSLALSLVSGLARDHRLKPELALGWAKAIGQKLRNDEQGPWRGFRDSWVELDRSAAESFLIERHVSENDLDEGLFLSLRRDEKQLTVVAKRQWSDRIAEIAKRELETGRSFERVIYAWTEVDSGASEQFLCRDSDLDRIRPGNFRAYIDAVTAFGSPAAIQRLRSIVDRRGPECELAHKSLQLLGEESQEPIEILAAEWRSSRDGDLLTRLYDEYIVRLPNGTPFGPWLKRLGEPAEGTMSSQELFFRGSGGVPTLYIELDADGNVWGRKLE